MNTPQRGIKSIMWLSRSLLEEHGRGRMFWPSEGVSGLVLMWKGRELGLPPTHLLPCDSFKVIVLHSYSHITKKKPLKTPKWRLLLLWQAHPPPQKDDAVLFTVRDLTASYCLLFRASVKDCTILQGQFPSISAHDSSTSGGHPFKIIHSFTVFHTVLFPSHCFVLICIKVLLITISCHYWHSRMYVVQRNWNLNFVLFQLI